MSAETEQLVAECERQVENCRDTAVSFIIWLRFLRYVKVFFTVSPIVCGALATWQVLSSQPTLAAVFTLLATVLPPVYEAIKLDDVIRKYETAAGEFTNLRDRFRQAKLVSSRKPFAEFSTDFEELMDRLEKVRATSLAPPQWTLNNGQKIVNAGKYTNTIDMP